VKLERLAVESIGDGVVLLGYLKLLEFVVEIVRNGSLVDIMVLM
jgi:hypothetical protein